MSPLALWHMLIPRTLSLRLRSYLWIFIQCVPWTPFKLVGFRLPTLAWTWQQLKSAPSFFFQPSSCSCPWCLCVCVKFRCQLWFRGGCADDWRLPPLWLLPAQASPGFPATLAALPVVPQPGIPAFLWTRLPGWLWHRRPPQQLDSQLPN